MTFSYPPPVDRLLKLGAEPARRRTWPDYLTLGLEDRHVNTLVRMATDPALHGAPERDRAAWAPVHAWRALGQMQAPGAVDPLFALLEERLGNAWVREEVPYALGMIGPAALHTATLLLFDEGRDEELRLAAVEVIGTVAFLHRERADEAVALLAKQLEDWPHQSPVLNAALVAQLVLLRDASAAPVMEAAFAAGAVDVEMVGDWEDVQVDLGLLSARTTPPPDDGWADAHRAGSRSPSPDAASRARARRKAEKKARRRNRKKK
jgi:hypothetical protein